MGIQRWDCRAEENEGGGLFVNDFECDGGRYVLFTDHEQVVADLRSALAAKSAEVDGLLGALQVAELALRERGLRACAEYKEIESALAKAMEKSNEHQDQ